VVQQILIVQSRPPETCERKIWPPEASVLFKKGLPCNFTPCLKLKQIMVLPFTLYTNKVSPFGHSVELALKEANAEFTRFEIDFSNKPEWFASTVNPTGKIPVIAYGGPEVPADQPSPESTKIAESLVLLEFVSDLYPSANLLPKDPVLRAKARFIINVVSTKFFPAFLSFYILGNGPFENLVRAFEEIQALLPATGFAVGEWSIADAAFVPFVARLLSGLKVDLGGFPAGEGPRALKSIQESPKFERFNRYWKDVTARRSFVETFDEDYMVLAAKKKWAESAGRNMKA